MKKSLILVMFGLCLFVSTSSYALDAIDITTGYLDSHLDDTKKDYDAIPLMIGFVFDMKPLTSKIGINPKGRLDFILEPFVNTVIEPNSNVEVGSNFLFQYTFPLSERIQPYVKGGLGALYMSQHTLEQSTQYNFLPQGGAGIRYFIRPDVSLNLEYRYRHLSNASLKHPNSGINSNMYLGGITIFFDKGATTGQESEKNTESETE